MAWGFVGFGSSVENHTDETKPLLSNGSKACTRFRQFWQCFPVNEKKRQNIRIFIKNSIFAMDRQNPHALENAAKTDKTLKLNLPRLRSVAG